MRYIVDIDGTICTKVTNFKENYMHAKPIKGRIEYFNELYKQGHEIIYWTARGATSGIDWERETTNQLRSWGVKYTELRFCKPHYDVWIDDKAVNADDYFGNGV